MVSTKVRKIDYDSSGKKIREYEELQTGYDEVHVPPDTTAQIFWLKNRRPDRWRDKPVELSNSETNNLLEAIADSTSGEIDTDDLPEVE